MFKAPLDSDPIEHWWSKCLHFQISKSNGKITKMLINDQYKIKRIQIMLFWAIKEKAQ